MKLTRQGSLNHEDSEGRTLVVARFIAFHCLLLVLRGMSSEDVPVLFYD